MKTLAIIFFLSIPLIAYSATYYSAKNIVSKSLNYSNNKIEKAINSQ